MGTESELGVISGGVDVIESDTNTLLMSRHDDAPRYFWRNVLALPLVVADIALRNADGRSKRGLAKTKSLTYLLRIVCLHGKNTSATNWNCQ